MQTHLLSPFSGFIFILKELSKWESRSKPGMSFSFWSPLGLAAEVCDLVENYVGFHHVSVFLQGVWHWMCSFEAVALEYSLDGSSCELPWSLLSPLPTLCSSSSASPCSRTTRHCCLMQMWPGPSLKHLHILLSHPHAPPPFLGGGDSWQRIIGLVY